MIDKKILVILGILVVVVIAFSIFLFFQSQPTALTTLKKPCPLECCDDDIYLKKGCESGYECKSYQCIFLDSDDDGLSDAEERTIKTDYRLYDSDGDTLSDYDEVKILNTNPLNPNTDNDRYRDNEDSNPTTLNTAKIEIQSLDKAWRWNYDNLIILAGTLKLGGSLNPDMVIADPSVTLMVSNSGDDYTAYVNLDLVFEISNKEIYKEYLSLGRFDRSENKVKKIQRELRLVDIPQAILDSLTNQTTPNWNIKIENLEYEKWG